MRFILSFALMPIIGLALQTCSKSSTITNNIVKTDTKAANTTVQTNTNMTASAPSATPADAPRISLEEAKKDFDKGNALFIDTRSEAAYNVEHIKGAINITADEFETRYAEVPKNKRIIAYCS